MDPAFRVLGLDLSTYTGYALAVGGKIVKCGVRDFSSHKAAFRGKKYTSLFNFLISLGKINEIYVEVAKFNGGFKNKEGKIINTTNDGRELQHGLLAVVEMYCDMFGIIPIEVHPSTLKKEFAGHGHAEKADMCRAARAIGWKGGEDGTAILHDEADGIALVATQMLKRHGVRVHF